MRLLPDVYPLIWPLLRAMDPERAHAMALRLVRYWAPLVGSDGASRDPLLQTALWEKRFPNPFGIAAGFDKNAQVANAMLRLGFGFVEVGTVTLRPQAGNPRPRLFRLLEDQAVINRFGFNGEGADAMLHRLARRERSRGIVGVNVGPNRDASNPAADCAEIATLLGPYADYLVVNVSSPNTPGLRSLQAGGPLLDLLLRVRGARDASPGRPPLLVKVAPDLTPDERREIAEAVLSAGIDGLIATNTTVDRPVELRGEARTEAGGLSGAPLFSASTAVLADFYRLFEGKVPLIGVGGISSGADAYAKIRAGASLLQLYTALVYHGPGLLGRLCGELGALLRRDGYACLEDAVGADHLTIGRPAHSGERNLNEQTLASFQSRSGATLSP